MKKLFLTGFIFIILSLSAYAEQCLVFLGPDTKVMSEEYGYVKVSVKVEVRNTCSREVSAWVRFNGLERGFLVDYKPFRIKVADREWKTVSEIWSIKRSEFDKIDTYTFESKE